MDKNANFARDIDILTGQPMLSDAEGEPLFVINLCAAMTPQNLDDQMLPGLGHYKLYQVSRIEDGRRRYRLRLGFFTTEADAEDVLASVRKQFATAFTACLCDEDLKHASGYLKRSVQDLARTGRFKIKSRPATLNDPMTNQAATSDTAIVRVLKPAVAAGPTAATAASTISPIIGAKPNLAAASGAATANKHAPNTMAPNPAPRPTPNKVVAPDAAAETEFVWESKAPAIPVAPSKPVNVAVASKPLTTASVSAAPPPGSAQATSTSNSSLMRRAHALETLSTARGDRQLMATGKYPAQPISQSVAQPTIAKTQPSIAPIAVPTTAPIAAQQAAHVIGKAVPTVAPTTAPVQTKPVQSHAPQTKAIIESKAVTAPQAAQPAARSPQAPLKLEAAIAPPSAAPPPVHKASQPFHVGAGINIPETSLSLETVDAGPLSIHEAIATIDAPTLRKSSVHTATDSTALGHGAAPTISPIMTAAAISKEESHMADLMRARELAKQSSEWRQQHGEVPSLDTTQTIRILTKKEIEDVASEKWYIVQLAVSDQPVNLDTMPRLDIFEAYNLYSVATMIGDNIRHALRLGFFREEVSAYAVLGYLKTFFNDPTIERIADAEHDRFANSKANLAPRPENTPKPSGTVVDLEQKRPIRHTGVVPTVNTSVARESLRSKSPAQHVAKSSVAKPMQRAATPATKVAGAVSHAAARKPTGSKSKATNNASQRDMLDEARSLGFSETTIMRAQKNPSLLSRLVGKLTK